ncbi:MAG: hypothetical protein QXI54_07750 [Archaeoglobaceae archaeon]
MERPALIEGDAIELENINRIYSEILLFIHSDKKILFIPVKNQRRVMDWISRQKKRGEKGFENIKAMKLEDVLIIIKIDTKK